LEIQEKIKNNSSFLLRTGETEFKYIEHNEFFVKDFFGEDPDEKLKFFGQLRPKPAARDSLLASAAAPQAGLPGQGQQPPGAHRAFLTA